MMQVGAKISRPVAKFECKSVKTIREPTWSVKGRYFPINWRLVTMSLRKRYRLIIYRNKGNTCLKDLQRNGFYEHHKNPLETHCPILFSSVLQNWVSLSSDPPLSKSANQKK